MDIKTLAGEFKSSIELKDYCNKQYVALEQALKRVTDLQHEVAHLKELLAAAKVVPVVAPSIIPGNPEQTICEMQVNLLYSIAASRALTLEETKRLDLLVKNLLLIKAQPGKPIDYSLPKDVTEADLVSLAASQAPALSDE